MLTNRNGLPFVAVWLVASLPLAAIADKQDEQKPDADPPPVTLRYQFERGQYVHYEVDSRSTFLLTARNTTQTLDESKRTKKHYRVVAVDENGSAVLEPVIDKVLMRVKTDDHEPVIYDSENPEAELPKAFDSMKASIGKANLRVRFSATGQVEKVLVGKAEEDEQDPDKEEEDAAFLVPLPDAPLRQGDSWNDDYTIKVEVDPQLRLKQDVTVRRRYTLDKVEDGVAHITFRTYPLWNGRDPHVQAQLITHKLIGRVNFDVKRGLVLESQSVSEGQVLNAFGPRSAMKSTTNRVERYVPPPKRNGPAGPQLSGT